MMNQSTCVPSSCNAVSEFPGKFKSSLRTWTSVFPFLTSNSWKRSLMQMLNMWSLVTAMFVNIPKSNQLHSGLKRTTEEILTVVMHMFILLWFLTFILRLFNAFKALLLISWLGGSCSINWNTTQLMYYGLVTWKGTLLSRVTKLFQ